MLLKQVEDLSTIPHVYLCLEPDQAANWIDILAEAYVALRGGSLKPLNPLIFEGIQILDVAALRRRIQRATLPDRSGSNFDVVRSDFGEVMSYLVLENCFPSQFGYKQIRDRETIQLPGRGIDAIGVETAGTSNKVTLLLVETKVSEESVSPPQIVDSAPDSLRAQHLAHLGNHQATCRKIWDVSRKVVDESVRSLLFTAALYFEDQRWDKVELVCCCFLVRPAAAYTSSDYGTFRNRPSDYAPARIRFLVMRLLNAIKTTVDEWYEKALQHAGQK